MAEHPRTAIRKEIVRILKADGATTLRNVIKSRVHNFQERELPAAAVYTMSEPAGRANVKRDLQRELVLFIDIHLQAGADLDDGADAYALEIEAALAASPKLGGLCLDSWLTKTTIGLNGEGERRTGLCRLEYKVVYRTTAAGSAA